ncbi:MAG TPA: hypothetical protein VJB69_01300 [Candidatus Paceibacterota bacterium]
MLTVIGAGTILSGSTITTFPSLSVMYRAGITTQPLVIATNPTNTTRTFRFVFISLSPKSGYF